MNKQMIAIYNSEGRIFSGIKTFTPKLVNEMKKTCEVYDKIFAPSTHKVCRLIQTRNGWKKI